jgi:AcrR family transcriptional regulator
MRAPRDVLGHSAYCLLHLSDRLLHRFVPKGRPRSFDRDDALRRAMLLFWRHGYDATSISLLTEAMGIGAPSLYAAFGDKRALFKEALERDMSSHGSFMVRARGGAGPPEGNREPAPRSSSDFRQ